MRRNKKNKLNLIEYLYINIIYSLLQIIVNIFILI